MPAAAKMMIAAMNLRIALNSLVLDSLEGSSASAMGEEYHAAGGAGDHSTLRPANSTTFFHLSVSALIISPKPSGEAISGAPPSSTKRWLSSGSPKMALISPFSFATTSPAVFLGAPRAEQRAGLIA